MTVPLHQILQPADWVPAKGYSNGVVARGRTVFLGGQIGWNSNQVFETDDFIGQVRQALENIVTLLKEAGAGPEHVVRLTWFITDKEAYGSRLRERGDEPSRCGAQAPSPFDKLRMRASGNAVLLSNVERGRRSICRAWRYGFSERGK